MSTDQRGPEDTIYTLHIGVPGSIRTIWEYHLDIDTRMTEASQSPDNLPISEVSMLDDDRALRTGEFSEDTLAHGETIFESHKYLYPRYEAPLDTSLFFLSSSSCDTICEFTRDLHHIVMPATSSIYRYTWWYTEILICYIHPADKCMTRLSEFIEEKYLWMIIVPEMSESEWPPGSYIGESDIFGISYEELGRWSGEYISSYFPETPEALHIVYSGAEGIFFDDDIYVREESRLLMECAQYHIASMIVPPHIHADTDTVLCLMDRHQYLHLRIFSIDDQSRLLIIPVFWFFDSHSAICVKRFQTAYYTQSPHNKQTGTWEILR